MVDIWISRCGLKALNSGFAQYASNFQDFAMLLAEAELRKCATWCFQDLDMRVNFTGVVAGEANAGLPKRAEDSGFLRSRS